MMMPRRCITRFSLTRVMCFALTLVVLSAMGAYSQAPPPPDSSRRDSTRTPAPSVDENACFGFSFGKWTPPLDWQAAGHGSPPSEKILQHAPDGRDWAADLTDSADSALVLFPSWWPAGVLVRLPKRLPVVGDTLRGRATALIADGRRQAPTAEVRAWAVPCRRAATAGSTARP
jgi:hypothetical protein